MSVFEKSKWIYADCEKSADQYTEYVDILGGVYEKAIINLSCDTDYTLYINGEYRDGFSLYGYYLEATLPDLTKVTVSVGKWSVRISFSNGHPSVEI